MSSVEIAELILTIANKYEFFSSILILFFGMISNILIILIFTILRVFRSNRSAYYLAIESTANIGLLLAILPFNIAGYMGQNLAQVSIVPCKLKLMSSQGFGFYSLFTICFLALDQYLSTNYRQSWRQISTLKFAHYLTFFNISFVLLHGIFFLVFGEIGSIGCSIYHPIAKIYFTFFYYPILGAIFPYFISSLFSLLAYRNVRRIVRRQIPLQRRRLDRQMTAIALARVICFVILCVPFIVFRPLQINISYGSNEDIKRAILNLSSIIANSFLCCNFSINFYVFLIISSRFRQQAKHFFLKKCWRSLTKLCNLRLTVARNNQVVPETNARHVSNVESV